VLEELVAGGQVTAVYAYNMLMHNSEGWCDVCRAEARAESSAEMERLREIANETVEAVDAMYHWHDVHEKNEPGHRCGFAAEYTANINLKERASALRAALGDSR
jgi:hypothetical protein